MDRFFIREKMEPISYITDEEDIKHITKVLRLREGDLIEVVDGLQEEYRVKISAISKQALEIVPEEKIEQKRELRVHLSVYQGVPKGQKMELIVQKLTEIGISAIYPVHFERCVSQMKEEKEEKKLKRYEKIAYEAAKQSKRTRIPTVHPVLDREELFAELEKNDCNLIFYEGETKRTLKSFFDHFAVASVQRMGIIIGPEGGLTKEEVESCVSCGCHAVSLGERILRTETAAVVAGAIVAYELEAREELGKE